MSKKSFILHIDSLSILDDLTDEQAGKLFKAIRSYQKDEDFELDQLTKIAFSPFKNQFIRDDESYQSVVERNRINGLKGGRPKKQQEAEETQKTQSVISKPKKADSDSKSDNDSDSDNNINTSSSSKMTHHIPYQQIVDLYHQILPELPECKKLTTKRKGQIRQRHINDIEDIETWQEYFEYIKGSNFLMGRVPPNGDRRPFIANLEWLTNESNYCKIYEGKYHG